jgi:RHS repeat-associated protein
MTSMPHLAAIAWDHADRMQHCDLGGGGDVWFVYDAGGERVRKVQVNGSGSTVRERVYLGGYEVYRERAANSAAPDSERQTLHVGHDRGKLALVETLTVDGGEPVGAPRSIQRHQYGNHLGSASLELDEGAAVISYEEFHPFGTTSYAANDAGIEVSAKRYRYIGKERDEETGLYHLGARYYASWLGRWTSADPIGLGDGVNRYAYARGNPVVLSDPAGTLSRPTSAEVSQYESDAERHNTQVATWHAEYATFTNAAANSGHTARRLERERVSLLEREGQLAKQWVDLVLKTVDADISDFRKQEQERQFEYGPPDSWTLSGRSMNRVSGAAKLSTGLALGLASGGLLAGVVAADFGQAGIRQIAGGDESNTIIRGGTTLISEGAFGQGPRTARTHGDIAETFGPVVLGAWALGRSAAGPSASQLHAREVGRHMAQGFSEAQARYLAMPYPSRGMGEHFFKRSWARDLGVPNSITNSQFNVLKPPGITRGRMYELHYAVDRDFYGAGLGRGAARGRWSGDRLGLVRLSGLSKTWHGSPRPLKLLGGLGAAGLGSYSLYTGMD